MRRTVCLLFILAAVRFSPACAQTGPAARWEGVISLTGFELDIVVHLRGAGDSLHGTIDIPAQMAMGLSLTHVRATLPGVHFELPAGPGLAVFDGTLAGDTIAGDFRQGTAAGRFRLHRTAEPPPAVRTPPTDFREEEVKVFNGPVTLAGTLSMPLGGGPFPAAILLTGSGAQNRDEEILGFAPFRILAEHLTRSGFAVLRCDDRGVGGSTGDMHSSTTADFAADAMAMVKSLTSRPEIRASEIGLIGHSEGAVVASMCAARSRDIAFLVLLAGPALPGDSTILSQIDALGRLSGLTPAEIGRNQELERRVFAAVRAQKGWDDLRKLLRAETMRSLDQLPAEQKAALTHPDSLADARVDVQINAVRTPWFRFFISHDPVTDLRKVQCPLLALYGDLDKQVIAPLNILRMKAALAGNGNNDVQVVTIPGANHLFQRAVTGHPSEYAQLKKEFAEGVLGEISSWLKKHFPP